MGMGWVSVETGATNMQQFYYHQQRPTTPLPAPHHHHHYYDDGYYSNNNQLQNYHLRIHEEDEDPEEGPEEEEIETLPLFPVNSQETQHENTSHFQSYFLGQQQENQQAIRSHQESNNNLETSLVLTLNSYYAATTPHGSA